jgi:hypothetical protein
MDRMTGSHGLDGQIGVSRNAKASSQVIPATAGYNSEGNIAASHRASYGPDQPVTTEQYRHLTTINSVQSKVYPVLERSGSLDAHHHPSQVECFFDRRQDLKSPATP